MKYIPSPVPIKFKTVYRAQANTSGRMQYYKISPGVTKQRISRQEFITAFNEKPIIAMKPIPIKDNDSVFQLEFYV